MESIDIVKGSFIDVLISLFFFQWFSYVVFKFSKIIYNGSPKTFLNDINNRNFNIVMENNVWTIK